jgi:hypothetical protein
MATQEDRARESRESDETKFEQAGERESEERERLADRVTEEELEPDESAP